VLVSKEEKAWGKRIVFSLDFKTATESLLRTVFGSEFQTAGAEHRKAFSKCCHRERLTLTPAEGQQSFFLSDESFQMLSYVKGNMPFVDKFQLINLACFSK